MLEPSIQTTVQDYPGRLGMLAQGFFPAGPMDSFAFRAANLLVRNGQHDAGLEVTMGHFVLRFLADVTFAVCGPETELALDGQPVGMWESHRALTDSVLRTGVPEAGFRLYVALGGGIDVEPVFGSRATYTMGAVGGLDGRPLKRGDVLLLGKERAAEAGLRFPASLRPTYVREWEIAVMEGPQAAPDFLTEHDVNTLFSRFWSVDRNSNRTGIRLEPYRFEWARTTGGIAGGHPSNILDNPYPVGAVNINGDLPVILGPDGPTAGGFVVPATVVEAERWKLGQLRPVGDRIRLRRVDLREATRLRRVQEELLTEASLADSGPSAPGPGLER